jgi:hypothetical protein
LGLPALRTYPLCTPISTPQKYFEQVPAIFLKIQQEWTLAKLVSITYKISVSFTLTINGSD